MVPPMEYLFAESFQLLALTTVRDYHGNIPPKKFYWEDLNLLGGIINQGKHWKHFMILRLYGYLGVQLLNQVIVQLCYS